MKSELLAKSPLLLLPLCALFLFLTVFIVMFVVTMRRRAGAYGEVSRLPLDDDDATSSEVQARADAEGGEK